MKKYPYEISTMIFAKQEEREERDKQWFVLNFINKPGKPSPKVFLDDFNREGHDLELFAPIIRPAHIVNGKVRYVEKLLTFFYVFVRGSMKDVKTLCVRPENPFSLMLDRSSEKKYAVISDSAMDNFKIIARAHTNSIDFFNIDDIDLNEGDTVEVVGGEYNGLTGTFIPKSKSSKGNLVIAAAASMGAIIWEIDAKTVRIREFARDTRRQYDITDSFIHKLLPILRKFHANLPLSDKEKSQLTVFNRRMGLAKPHNHKAEAKLLAVLMSVQTILGDMAGLTQSRDRFEKRKEALTNAWTLALVELMLSVANNDMERLKKEYETISAFDNPTNTQAHLMEEYRHYLQDS